MSGSLSFDLFCRVVDNFGDAGVCWRLARRLAALGQSVRLWIDRPEVLARLLPALDAQAAVQTLDGVQISAWDRAGQARPPRGG
ncbi:MAG: elongation factor P maturation arginine rhamnosyltransferase EarP, partial [Castellaniella sp.]|uniref:elongation factor P maturation arginine rhamnosyltransferase EarP n=1 Tax=Castellaniella sp. TaxID=1955812 RepID=UPI003C750FB1